MHTRDSGKGVGKVSLVASVSRYARQEVVEKVTFPEQFLWWKTTSAVCMAAVAVVKSSFQSEDLLKPSKAFSSFLKVSKTF